MSPEVLEANTSKSDEVVKNAPEQSDDSHDEQDKIGMIPCTNLLDFYWKYFELQSNQRNQTCGLYFTLLTALLGGFMAAVELKLKWIGVIILLAIFAISVAFGLLFWRSTKLRDDSRKLIADFEKEFIKNEKWELFSKLEMSEQKEECHKKIETQAGTNERSKIGSKSGTQEESKINSKSGIQAKTERTSNHFAQRVKRWINKYNITYTKIFLIEVTIIGILSLFVAILFPFLFPFVCPSP